MGRWIAIGKAPGWDDLTKFTTEMKPTAAWRPEARTTITSVAVLTDGRLVAECHAGSQEEFEAWLKQKGWQIDSIAPIKHIARTGEIWKV